MKAKGYLTQCDAGGIAGYYICSATIRLAVPRKWRCDECTVKFGKLFPPQFKDGAGI